MNPLFGLPLNQKKTRLTYQCLSFTAQIASPNVIAALHMKDVLGLSDRGPWAPTELWMGHDGPAKSQSSRVSSILLVVQDF
jgi:hypothetical protein